jgi:hypothetical protein
MSFRGSGARRRSNRGDPAGLDLSSVGDTRPAQTRLELPAVDLTCLDLTDEQPVIDLTGSAPALELAARLSLPVPWPDATLDGAARELDPVVQVLIDRVRVKQAVARGGRAVTGSNGHLATELPCSSAP